MITKTDREGGFIKDFENKLGGLNESFKKDAGQKKETGVSKSSAGERNTPKAGAEMLVSDGLEQLLRTPGPERDRFVTGFLKGKSPEERTQFKDMYGLLSDSALRQFVDEDDEVAMEELGARLANQDDKASQQKGMELLERVFRKNAAPKAAVQLMNREVQNGGSAKEVVRLGETAIDRYLERYGLQEEKPENGISMSIILYMLNLAYKSEDSLAKEREPYKSRRSALHSVEDKIRRAQPESDSSGFLVFLMIVYFALCAFAIATNYRLGGAEFGGPAGIIALLVFCITCWVMTDSFFGMLLSVAAVLGVVYGLTELLHLETVFNVSVAPLALLAVIALILIIWDRGKYSKWKREQPKRQAEVEKIRKAAREDAVFCRDYCKQRIALAQMIQRKVVDVNEDLKDIRLSDFQKLYRDELNWVEETAKKQGIPL